MNLAPQCRALLLSLVALVSGVRVHAAAFPASVVLPSSASFAPRPVSRKEIEQGYRDGRLIAMPKAAPATYLADFKAGRGPAGFKLLERLDRNGVDLFVLEIETDDPVPDAIKKLEAATNDFDFVEPDYIITVHAPATGGSKPPIDQKFGRQWSLNNEPSRIDIDALEAWKTPLDTSGVVVAIIDTGIYAAHEDLKENLWRPFHPFTVKLALGEKTFTRFSRALDGWRADTTRLNGDDDSQYGHGTHVAGIIGAKGNNSFGIAGISWDARLMALKAFVTDVDQDGVKQTAGSVRDEVACIDFAIAHGAKIINASFGHPYYSRCEFRAIQRARAAGIVFVVAPWQHDTPVNNDVTPNYPASYPLDNIVAVASSTRSDRIAPTSDYGSGRIELAAPGVDILSCGNQPDHLYTVLSGTSFAAPHVSGALALLRAKFPQDNYRQSINRLLRSVVQPEDHGVPVLAGLVGTAGRLNLAHALACSDPRPFNDDFDRRAILATPREYYVMTRGSNAGASAETGEPTHGPGVGGCSLWWTWEAPPQGGSFVISTEGSQHAPVVAVYTGEKVNALASVALMPDDHGPLAQRYRFDAVGNAKYQIAVDRRTKDTGNIVLTLGQPPSNDDRAAAQPLPPRSGNFSIEGQNRLATVERGEPPLAAHVGGHSVWYTWRAVAAGSWDLTVSSGEIAAVAVAFSAADSNPWQSVARAFCTGANASAGRIVVTEQDVGTIYHIGVDSLNSGVGTFFVAVAPAHAKP